MKLTNDDTLRIIGDQSVSIYKLRSEIESLKHQVAVLEAKLREATTAQD